MRMRWAGLAAQMGEKTNAYRILVRKPEGKRHRWVDNIRMELREIGSDGVDWTDGLRIGTSGGLL
jgi:hypothetical protein